MTTIYFSRRDYRDDMRDPKSSARAHAICRRLLGVPACWDGRDVRYPDKWRSEKYPPTNTLSVWYGAHYYAACAATSLRESVGDALRFWRRAFAREISSGEGKHPERLTGRYKSLWRLAIRRVWAIRQEAMALPHSALW